MFKKKVASPVVFNIKSRMRIMGLLMLFIPLIIFIRLFYMQTFLHEAFASKAERAIYNYLSEDRLRGKILDVNGKTLAESVRTHSCGISKRYVKDKNKTVDFLAKILGLPKKQILEKWNKHSPFFFVAKKIKPDVYIQMEEMLHTSLGQGLELTPEYERIHPYGDSALDILGTANSKNFGLSGIEQMFNKELSQDISKKRAKHARRGAVIYDRKLKEERSVGNVYLTIDAVAQYYTETALQKAVEEVGAEHGVALVQEPKTGRILAAASYPAKDGQSLAFQFTYEPGSTFKTIAIASALDAGTVRVTDSIDMDGRKWEVIKGFTVRDNQHKKDYLSVPEIMQLSSNIGAGKIALDLGAKNLYFYIKAFGFGSKTDINFNGESKGSVLPYNKWTKVDTVTKGYGYGVAVTPIQLINAYSAIANGGVLMQPHLIDRIEYANGKVEKYAKPIKIRNVFKHPQSAATITKVLQSVVENGSGKRAQITGYNVAGKTGTAEKLSKEGGYGKRSHVVSFCGFVPATDPQFTVLVILDNPAKYTFGGTAAAPVFKEIAQPLLARKGVKPDQLDFE
ncbi:peptidoglycan D,D-transpeptidase FtsI family protein [Candidatus Avelusimicrobium caledoniensis]|uniref:peptidoglycan D,D-transpeptidase FtsI family protein n=1 Tax=Candidatus Avelusimicrobium caledoniensis TaxID=3416220 RepID=UPI003D0A7CBE